MCVGGANERASETESEWIKETERGEERRRRENRGNMLLSYSSRCMRLSAAARGESVEGRRQEAGGQGADIGQPPLQDTLATHPDRRGRVS